MTMEHRAFRFDYASFSKDLKPILESALSTGNVEPLASFIETNSSLVKNPYDGGPLEENWQDAFDMNDPHQIGDVALTAYYDPSEDCGLGAEWEMAATVIESVSKRIGFSPVLGRSIESSGIHFDPGKMGSYFQSQHEVEIGVSALADSTAHDPRIAAITEMLEGAHRDHMGLYVTF